MLLARSRTLRTLRFSSWSPLRAEIERGTLVSVSDRRRAVTVIAPASSGCPALVAAASCARATPGASRPAGAADSISMAMVNCRWSLMMFSAFGFLPDAVSVMVTCVSKAFTRLVASWIGSARKGTLTPG